RGAGGKVELLQPLLAVFEHVAKYRHTWGPLSRKGGADVITRILREHVAELVRANLRSQFHAAGTNQTPLAAAVEHVTGACMGVLTWWLDNDIAYSAEEIHAIFRRLSAPGLRRFMAAR
ncbi:MAG: TetR-like C-terminal domain-containing protein, partial [Gammaproteobacteria bacterium]